MKKALITALLVCTSISNALAQGLITFTATGTSTTDWVPGMIGYSDYSSPPYKLVPAGNPAKTPWGNLNVALYGAPLGTKLTFNSGVPDLTTWKMQTSPVLQALAAAGYMTAKTVTMDGRILNAKGELQLTVVGWTGTAPNFIEASGQLDAVLAWSGNPANGGALSWASGSGKSTAPYFINKGPNAFNGLVFNIPEPSTLALTVSGTAALLVLRRSKCQKVLVAALLVCTSISNALAQGIITFSATGTSTTGWVPGMIGYGFDPPYQLVPAGNPAQVGYFGNLNIALYGAPLGTELPLRYGIPDLSNWKIQTSPILQSLAAPGYMTGKTVTMDRSILNANGELQLTVVGWTGSATSFTAAAASPNGLLAWSGNPANGGALSWASGSGSTTTPYVITKGPNAFNGLLLTVPEPSSLALVVAGAAALLVLRSRNRG